MEALDAELRLHFGEGAANLAGAFDASCWRFDARQRAYVLAEWPEGTPSLLRSARHAIAYMIRPNMQHAANRSISTIARFKHRLLSAAVDVVVVKVEETQELPERRHDAQIEVKQEQEQEQGEHPPLVVVDFTYCADLRKKFVDDLGVDITTNIVERLATFNISTITLALNSPLAVQSKINIAQLRALILSNPLSRLHIPNKKSFMNSVVCKVESMGQLKSVKIFSNGKLHLTGVRNGTHAMDVVDAALETILSLKKASVAAEPTGADFAYVEMQLCMLNCYFHIGYKVDLDEFKDVLFRHYNVPGLYHRDSYPGLKFKTPADKIKVIMFNTGNVLVSSSNVENILKAKEFVAEVAASQRARVMERVDGKRAGLDSLKKEVSERAGLSVCFGLEHLLLFSRSCSAKYWTTATATRAPCWIRSRKR